MTDPVDPKKFLGKPAEWDLWSGDRRNWRNTPQFCAKHWKPCPVEGKNGILASVLVMMEGFAFLPANVTTPSAMNSWWANQTTPICCKLGDEKMAWLWWLIDNDTRELFCNAKSEHKGDRNCWRPKDHADEHEWERPIPRSIFDLMSELHP